MKSFSVLAICFMLSSIWLVYKELCWQPENNPVKYDFPVEIENLRFSTNSSAENIRMITAEFDLESGIESTGEIEIVVDGEQKANNRLFVKKGLSHYSVDFLLSYRDNAEDQHLYSAAAKLSIKGTSADIEHQAFGINTSTLAGRHNENQ